MEGNLKRLELKWKERGDRGAGSQGVFHQEAWKVTWSTPKQGPWKDEKIVPDKENPANTIWEEDKAEGNWTFGLNFSGKGLQWQAQESGDTGYF